jgi:hypothetical protein
MRNMKNNLAAPAVNPWLYSLERSLSRQVPDIGTAGTGVDRLVQKEITSLCAFRTLVE